jgi:hypothetical protein
MSELLKGNFQTKKSVEAPESKPETLEDRFEKAAMKRLGGSIAYVAKKKVMWGAKQGD